MIIIVVTTTVARSNKELFEKTIQSVCDEAIKLDGCNNYNWYRDNNIEDAYMVYGEFESMDYFLSYKDSHVVQMIVKEIIPLTSSAPKHKHFEGEIFEEG